MTVGGDMSELNNGWTEEIARLQAELEQAQDMATKAVQSRIADAEKITKLEAEIERLYERDGKAHIEIIHPVLDDPNPFHRITLKKIDFGVADNCYVVECPEIESELEQARRERDEWKATAGHEADGLESWKKVAEKAEAELADARGRLAEFKSVVNHIDRCGECWKSSWCPQCEHTLRYAIIKLFDGWQAVKEVGEPEHKEE
jgi:DNA repair exonuclease SbcCD ATPase subunit